MTAPKQAAEPLSAEGPYPESLTCQDCGRHHALDTSLPSDIWNQIAKPEDLLCVLCIDRRLAAAGLQAECEFYFVGYALTSRLYNDSYGDNAALRSRLSRREEALRFYADLDNWAHIPLKELPGGDTERRVTRTRCGKMNLQAPVGMALAPALRVNTDMAKKALSERAQREGEKPGPSEKPTLAETLRRLANDPWANITTWQETARQAADALDRFARPVKAEEVYEAIDWLRHTHEGNCERFAELIERLSAALAQAEALPPPAATSA